MHAAQAEGGSRCNACSALLRAPHLSAGSQRTSPRISCSRSRSRGGRSDERTRRGAACCSATSLQQASLPLCGLSVYAVRARENTSDPLLPPRWNTTDGVDTAPALEGLIAQARPAHGTLAVPIRAAAAAVGGGAEASSSVTLIVRAVTDEQAQVGR